MLCVDVRFPDRRKAVAVYVQKLGVPAWPRNLVYLDGLNP